MQVIFQLNPPHCTAVGHRPQTTAEIVFCIYDNHQRMLHSILWLFQHCQLLEMIFHLDPVHKLWNVLKVIFWLKSTTADGWVSLHCRQFVEQIYEKHRVSRNTLPFQNVCSISISIKPKLSGEIFFVPDILLHNHI